MELKINRKGTVKTVLIDDADWHIAKKYNWYITKGCKTYYAEAHDPGSGHKTVSLHRVLMGCTRGDGKFIDHKNRNGLDCRRGNMRIILKAGNQRNCIHKKKSNLPVGVWDRKNGKFGATIRINKKSKYLGQFDSAEEAGYAYEAAYDIQIEKETLL